MLLRFRLLAVLALCTQAASAQISITANRTAQQLAQKLAGPGITISNPVLTCPGVANGIFKGLSSLGIDSGVVLTTGRALTAGSSYGINGPASANASTNNSAPGDAQLATLANSTTYDACRLEFDLVAKGDSVRFDYVFGSEEYNTSTCGSFNDAFAFFISGPGITGQQNMALVPGTTIPVAVNTINSGVPGSSGTLSNCTSMGAGSPFTSYYVSNATGAALTYRGFTTVLQAVRAVTPCSTYHLKMTIADAGNSLYDSGVFLKSGSLKTNSYSVAAENIPGGAQPFLVRGCTPGTVSVKRSQRRSTAQTVRFVLVGSALNGVDYAKLPDSVVIPANDTVGKITLQALPAAGGSGPKTVKLLLLSPYSCNGPEVLDSLTVTLLDGLRANVVSPDTAICRGQGVNLRVDGDSTLTYVWTPALGLNDASRMQPVAAPTASVTYVLEASLPASGCAPVRDTVRIRVDTPVVVSAGPDQSFCVGQTLSLQATVSPAGTAGSWSGPGGFNSANLQPRIQNAGAAASGTYVFAAGAGVCPASADSVLVSIQAPPPPPDLAAPLTVCLQAQLQPADTKGLELRWYTTATGGAGSPALPPTPTGLPGAVSFFVSQVQGGCESERAPQEVIFKKCCADNLIIPTAFSPNGDGRNDRFTITKSPEDLVLQCAVYNRWGQAIFQGREGEVWDGRFGGEVVEQGTYFYSLLLSCPSGVVVERRGDVTVVR